MTSAINSRASAPPSNNATAYSSFTGPPPSTPLFNDRVSVINDQRTLASLITAPTSSSLDVTGAQDQFNQDLAIYKADLSTLYNNTNDPNESDKPIYDAAQWNDASQHDWAGDQLKNITSDYKQPLFSDWNAVSSPIGITSGKSFPGGDQGQAFNDMASLEGHTDAAKLPAGYVSPPTMPPSSSIESVYNSLSPAQSAFLGWALETGGTTKQVGVPPEDVATWSKLAGYAQDHDNYLKTGLPEDAFATAAVPGIDSALAATPLPDMGVDAQVASAYIGNKSDTDMLLSTVFGVAGAFLPLDFPVEGAAEGGAAAIADTSAEAALEGSTGALDSAELATFDPADAAQAAGTDTFNLSQDLLGSVSKTDAFNNDAANGTTATLGDLDGSDDYNQMFKDYNENISSDLSQKYNLTQDETSALNRYTVNGTVDDALFDAMDKLPKNTATTFRYQRVDDATLQKILSGNALTPQDLVGGDGVVSTMVGGAPGQYNTQDSVKFVISANSGADGSTWIAPFSAYGPRENEALYTDGTFTVDGTQQDASGQWTVYLTHHA